MKASYKVIPFAALASAIACTGTIKEPDTTKGGACSLTPGATIDQNVSADPDVRGFLQASVDFTTAAEDLKGKVLTACANVAKDLGANDTWSKLDGDAKISNDAHTGACDVAGQKIEALVAGAPLEAVVALDVKRGGCRIDYDEQTRCDQQCSQDHICASGGVETRCEPGKLSVVCEGECSASSFCEGKQDHPANCMGKCESTCTGSCSGMCVAKDGKVTINDANCHGKCTASCNGQCEGMCKVDTNVNCGASVRCTGSCMGTFTDPVCTTKCLPPKCDLVTQCHESCSASVIAHAVCEPTQVDVFVDLAIAPQLEPLAKTLKANLPPLIDAAQSKGVLLIDAADRLAKNGETLANKIGGLDGKSVACTTLATAQLGKAAASLKLVSNACVSVHAKVETRIAQ